MTAPRDPLVRSRRLLSGLLDARACAVRVRLDADCDRRLRYVVEVPAHAARALRNGVGSFEGVELREVVEEPEPAGGRVARAELVLARASVEPLRATGLDPDPLTGFARALADLDSAHGEGGVVCVDLLR